MSYRSKFKKRILLLTLILIFPIYKTLDALLNNDTIGFYLWLMFLIIFGFSLIIMYIVYYKKKINIAKKIYMFFDLFLINFFRIE